MFINKFILLFVLFAGAILFGNVELKIFKAASPQYIEGNRTIHYTLVISDDSVSESYPIPITVVDNTEDIFTDADITITDDGNFTCDVNSSNHASEIICEGNISQKGGIVYIFYDVKAPDIGRQITNEASVYYGNTIEDTASLTVTVFPNYVAESYSRDLCYVAFPAPDGQNCQQSGAFLYGSDCNSSILIKRRSEGKTSGDLHNVHVYKAYTSKIISDACYSEESGTKIDDCGLEKNLNALLKTNSTSSLYFLEAFSEAHDFSLGEIKLDDNRTLIDINTIAENNANFEYIVLISQYNYAEGIDGIEEYIYPCGSYSIPPAIISETAGGVNDVQLLNKDVTSNRAANYIDYGTYDKVGTKIVNQPFILGVTYLDSEGKPADYVNEDGMAMPVILLYEAYGKSTAIWAGQLVPDEDEDPDHIFTIKNDINKYNKTLAQYPVIAEASRSANIRLQQLDYSNLFRVLGDDFRCHNNSLISSLCGVPACLNSAGKIVEVLPVENYPHVALCIYGDGGGHSPCNPDAYIGSCGGLSETISPSKYNHDLGCMHCLADAFGPGTPSDPFAIRPKGFSLEVADSDSKDDGLYQAGVPYPIDLNATTGNPGDTQSEFYTTTLERYHPQEVLSVIGLEHNATLVCPYDDNDSQTIQFTNGYSFSTINYSNVGRSKLVIMDQNWTKIDQVGASTDDFECIFDSNETDPTKDSANRGRVGCKLITEKSMTFIPDHFKIDANLIDHNSASQFTYLHDFNQSASEAGNWSKSDYMGTMAAILDVNVSARGYALVGDGNITSNYIEGCYAKETNLNLTINETNITHAGFAGGAALSRFLYYNNIIESEGSYPLPEPSANKITITQLVIKNNITTFIPNVSDGNGTAHLLYRINFDRKMNHPVNPFRLKMIDANITDEDNVTGADTDDSNASFYFARAKPSKYFYDDVPENSIDTPISVVIYNDPATSTYGLDLAIFKSTGEYSWYLSSTHTTSDGNLTLIAKDSNTKLNGSSSTTYSNLSAGVFKDSSGSDISASYSGGNKPHISDINLTGTNSWLIYNPDANNEPNPFYRVRFIGTSDWAGLGKTGNVVESNASIKKNRRLGW